MITISFDEIKFYIYSYPNFNLPPPFFSDLSFHVPEFDDFIMSYKLERVFLP